MRNRTRCVALTGTALAALIAAASPAAAVNAADCPNGGVVRFGVEPYDTAPKLVPIYDHIGQLIAQKLGCEVKVFITTSYNAEIEAMRSGKLEAGEFGPLGYGSHAFSSSPRKRRLSGQTDAVVEAHCRDSFSSSWPGVSRPSPSYSVTEEGRGCPAQGPGMTLADGIGRY